VNRLAQAAALASLKDKDHTAKSVKLNAESIGMMNDFFGKKKLEYIESRSNFVFVNTGEAPRKSSNP
jgi:histidinol-phosphate/aromatic aminotransferase/cobyric acid decarboxylase-like protein